MRPDLYLLSGFPPAAFNVYAIRDGDRWMLVDTATRHARRRIMRQLPGELEAIFITHAHRDHAGAMHEVAKATGAPVWGSEADADALEGKAPEPANEAKRGHIVNRLFAGWWKDRHPVARRLADGETGRRLRGVAFPGHTPGQIGLWRESDRTVLCADTMRSVNLVTGLPQLGRDAGALHVRPRRGTAQHPQARGARGAHDLLRARAAAHQATPPRS